MARIVIIVERIRVFLIIVVLVIIVGICRNSSSHQQNCGRAAMVIIQVPVI